MVDERKVGILDSSLNLDPSFRIGDRFRNCLQDKSWPLSKPIGRSLTEKLIQTKIHAVIYTARFNLPGILDASISHRE